MEIDPYDIAPVENRRTMSETGSTSSMSTGSLYPLEQAEQPAQGQQPLGLLVHPPGVVTKQASGLDRVELQPAGLGIEQVDSPSRRH